MYETYGVYSVALGALLATVGYLWILVRAWQADWRWLLGILLIPLVLPIFVCVKFRRTVVPAFVLLIGIALAGGTVAANLYLSHHIDFGPREKIVNGEQHITITGWDNPVEDYAMLAERPDVVVLQMANPDVTDDTLQYLTGLSKLEELDLNDTQVTDVGLAAVAQLPRLRVLRLRGTQMTDEGFRDNLLSKESLLEIDARETAVASKSLREWKNAKKELRRYLK